MKHRLTLILSATGLVLYASAAAASASTAQSPQPAHHRYCTARAEPMGSSAVPVMTCYRTFAESIWAATDGRVRLPASAKPGSVTPDQLNATVDGPYTLSIDYSATNFNGSSINWTQLSKCGYYEIPSMPTGWNDKVASVATGSTCALTLYQNTNYGGSTYRVTNFTAVTSLGTFNFQASSQRWCPTYPCS